MAGGGGSPSTASGAVAGGGCAGTAGGLELPPLDLPLSVAVLPPLVPPAPVAGGEGVGVAPPGAPGDVAVGGRPVLPAPPLGGRTPDGGEGTGSVPSGVPGEADGTAGFGAVVVACTGSGSGAPPNDCTTNRTLSASALVSPLADRTARLMTWLPGATSALTTDRLGRVRRDAPPGSRVQMYADSPLLPRSGVERRPSKRNSTPSGDVA